MPEFPGIKQTFMQQYHLELSVSFTLPVGPGQANLQYKTPCASLATYLLWKETMQKVHRKSYMWISIHLSHKDSSQSLPSHFLGRGYVGPKHRLLSKCPCLLSTLDRDMRCYFQDDFSGEQFTLCFVHVSRVLKFRGQLDEIGCNQFASSNRFCT